MTDWLDDVLQQRPVDDDGFTARVVRLADAQRARRILWRRLALVVSFVVVVSTGRACLVAADDVVQQMSWSKTGPDDATLALDTNRARVFAALQRLDAIPLLARRDGPDATAVLKQAIATDDHTLLTGLDRFGVLNDTPWANLQLTLLAREHLRAATEAPLVDGEPAPFVAAAHDIEALGRLLLTHSESREYFELEYFELVNTATDEARAAHKDGGFVPTLDEKALVTLSSVQRALWLYASPAARDEDFATLRATRSVIVCNLVRTRDFYRVRMKDFFDERTVARPASLSMTGCADAIVQQPLCEDVDLADLFETGCLSYHLARLPPWRGRVRDSWFHINTTWLLKGLP
jgi:hypothetical protein